MSRGGDELAKASGHRVAADATVSTAPGSSGSRRVYRSAIRLITRSAIATAGKSAS
jgi:hypothetical protein